MPNPQLQVAIGGAGGCPSSEGQDAKVYCKNNPSCCTTSPSRPSGVPGEAPIPGKPVPNDRWHMPPIDQTIFDQLLIVRHLAGNTFEMLSGDDIAALKAAYEQAVTADPENAPLEFHAQQVAFFEQNKLLLHELRAVQAQRQLLSNQARQIRRRIGGN